MYFEVMAWASAQKAKWAIYVHTFVAICRQIEEAMAKLSFILVFLSGLATAIVVYLFLSTLKQSARILISPYGLLPSSASIYQIGVDEVAFGVFSHALDGIHDVALQAEPHAKVSQGKKDDSENTSAVAEALASLHMALEMKTTGKVDKALKLLKHAMALYPSHPDILNHYGEFLEEQNNDIVQADHLYTKASIVCPGHARAITNRQRTFPQVEELDNDKLERIDAKRALLAQIPEGSSALNRVKREAYFQHIYHTVGIEGNTMSLAQTRHIIETRMAVAGKSILEHSEILGLDAALSYINSTLVHRIGAITVQDILEIHRRVLGFADPIEGGTFRRTQVFIGDHVPARPSEVRLLMEDFVQWLNAEEALRMHPVDFAALAHYKLVFIHPFTDGNGRLGRLLMNLILMQAGFPPVIIRKQDRQHYYEYLKMADDGDVRPFVRFIADCTEKTLDAYLYATKEFPEQAIPALEGHSKFKKPIIIE